MKINITKTKTCIFCLALALTVTAGCAGKKKEVPDSLALQTEGEERYMEHSAQRFARDYNAAVERDDSEGSFFVRNYQDTGKKSKKKGASGGTGLISTARKALGTPYVPGGTSTDGFDCSGFVQWTYDHVGIKLPRTAREQSQIGKSIRDQDDLQVGDIVAFRHPKRGYHTGIYVGEGKFIHSPRKRNVVRINSLDDPYFSRTFMGARRVTVSNEADIQAAENMLSSYDAEKYNRKSSALAALDRKKNKDVKKSSRSQKNKRDDARMVAERKKNAKESGMRTVAERNTSKSVKRDDDSRKKDSKKKENVSSRKKSANNNSGEKSSQKRANSKYQSVAKRS